MIESWYEATNKTWGTVLADTIASRADAELLVAKDQRVRYGEFYELVQRFARGLLDIGTAKDEATALWMTNCPEWLVAQFAAYEIGCPLVPLNTRLARDEIAVALRQSDAATLVVRDRFLGEKTDAAAWLEALLPELFRSSDPRRLRSASFPRLRRVVWLGENPPRGAYPFEEVLERGRGWQRDDVLRRAQILVNPFDVVNVIYTSGTTGTPKGGMSMHRTNLAALHHWAKRSDLRPSDRMYCGVPLATNFGRAYVAQLSILVGNTIVLHERFEPGAALAAIERERITWFPGAPTMYLMMLAHPELERFDLRSLRAAIVGGAPCPPETIRAIRDRLGFRHVVQCYGLSECGGLSTSTLLDDPIERIATSVGRPFPSSRLRVVDAKTGADVAAGETGEIWLGDVYPGSCVGKGYYGDPAKTGEAITPDGWFRTGDLGAIDSEGCLRITGRLKEMFLVGGYNAYPAEIEAALHAHPKVKMAAVFGVPDARLGEVGFAYVELRHGETATADEIVAFCKERLAGWKAPRHVGFLRAEEFPLTASGKVQKFKLRERAAAELGE